MKLHELNKSMVLMLEDKQKQEWLDKVNGFLAGEFRGDWVHPLTVDDSEFEYYGINCHPKHAALDIYKNNLPIKL